MDNYDTDNEVSTTRKRKYDDFLRKPVNSESKKRRLTETSSSSTESSVNTILNNPR